MNACHDGIFSGAPALDPFDSAIARELDPAAAGALRACISQVRAWRAPPNWSVPDWHKELGCVAFNAAWQAKREYDPAREVPLGSFVYLRVKAWILTRYRQEWRYGLRFIQTETEMMELLAGASPALQPAESEFEALNQALGSLLEPERWLLEQLFWHHRTESSIAAELRISQPAVSKRKQAALVHLRASFQSQK